MSLFYLDTEFSNGNFYLGDIFEIAVISERSGNAFHTLIKIPTRLDSYVKFICSITDNVLQREGITFKQAFDGMINFINTEAKGEPVIILAHSGFLFDFPLIVINCLKNKCNTDAMTNYQFIDTLQILQQEGESINNTGFSLKTLSIKVLGNTMPVLHSAFNDAKTLMQIFQHSPYKNILSQNVMKTFTIQSINQYLSSKMPITIDNLYKLCANVSSTEQLWLLLSKHTRENTAVNKSTVKKICSYYLSLTIY